MAIRNIEMSVGSINPTVEQLQPAMSLSVALDMKKASKGGPLHVEAVAQLTELHHQIETLDEMVRLQGKSKTRRLKERVMELQHADPARADRILALRTENLEARAHGGNIFTRSAREIVADYKKAVAARR